MCNLWHNAQLPPRLMAVGNKTTAKKKWFKAKRPSAVAYARSTTRTSGKQLEGFKRQFRTMTSRPLYDELRLVGQRERGICRISGLCHSAMCTLMNLLVDGAFFVFDNVLLGRGKKENNGKQRLTEAARIGRAPRERERNGEDSSGRRRRLGEGSVIAK